MTFVTFELKRLTAINKLYESVISGWLFNYMTNICGGGGEHNI